MKQVFFTNSGVRVEQVPAPVCGDKTVLVRTAFSLISSGTETSGISGKKEGLKQKFSTRHEQLKKVHAKVKEAGVRETIELVKDRLSGQLLEPTGYSLAGTIIEKGKLIVDLNVGDRVACAGSKIANHAEIVAVPRNLIVKIPNEITYEEASFATLGSIAMQGLRRSNASFGDTIVIVGLGLLGLLAVQIAKAAGCRVIGIEIEESRVEMARNLGANLVFGAFKSDVETEVYHNTNGIGADAVIIYAATKSSDPANQAMRMCRKKGRVVVVGDVGMDLQRRYMYEKELDFVISTSYGPGRYDKVYEEKGIDYPVAYVKWTENRNMEEFLKMISEKKVNVRPLISKEFPIEEARKAYQTLINSKNKSVAVLLKYPNSENFIKDSKFARRVFREQKISNTKSKNGKINIAVIGAGNFAQRVHMPNIKRIDGFNLKAVVGRHGESAKSIGNKFGAEYVTTNYKEALIDKKIDAFLICTRHNLHAAITIDAAKAGKSIFVEKPMCLDNKELKKIENTINQSGVKYTVGFNRRYSPLAVEAKRLLSNQKSPFVINYRVNAGFVAKDAWQQDPVEGGGRIVGECCHFFDLLNFFADEEIVDINASCIPIDNQKIVANDNFVATIKYRDGSIAVLTYVALGDKSLSKERIEIFSGGSSMVIEDFRKLELYGYNRKGIILKRQDKGQYNEMVEFLKQMQGKSSKCLSMQDAIRATEITFDIVKRLKISNNTNTVFKKM